MEKLPEALSFPRNFLNSIMRVFERAILMKLMVQLMRRKEKFIHELTF